MEKERAQEILRCIYGLKYNWQDSEGVAKCFLPGEKEEVIEKWRTMPGYTCFADALIRISEGK